MSKSARSDAKVNPTTQQQSVNQQAQQPTDQQTQQPTNQQTDKPTSMADSMFAECIQKLTKASVDHDKWLSDHDRILADHDRLFVTFDRKLTNLDERVTTLEQNSSISGKVSQDAPAASQPAPDPAPVKDATQSQPDPQPAPQTDKQTCPQPGPKSAGDYRMERWFMFWDFQNRCWSGCRKRDLYSAKAAGGGEWNPVWVWVNANGEYVRDLTPVENAMFAP